MILFKGVSVTKLKGDVPVGAPVSIKVRTEIRNNKKNRRRCDLMSPLLKGCEGKQDKRRRGGNAGRGYTATLTVPLQTCYKDVT